MPELLNDQLQDKTCFRLLKKSEHKEATLEWYENDLVICRYKAPSDVDVELINRINADILAMVEDRPYTVIVFAEPGVNFTAEGRAYGAEKGHAGNKKAWAAVSDNLAQILVVNFFVRFNKPKIPFKLFKKESEAREWLNTFMPNPVSYQAEVK